MSKQSVQKRDTDAARADAAENHPEPQTGCRPGPPRRLVSDYFDRGLRRSRAPELPIRGKACADAMNRFSVRFSLRVRHDEIADVAFRASTCAALLAYCELLREVVMGRRLTEACRVSMVELLTALPQVPTSKRDRATLAVAAFRAAVVAAHLDSPSEAGDKL